MVGEEREGARGRRVPVRVATSSDFYPLSGSWHGRGQAERDGSEESILVAPERLRSTAVDFGGERPEPPRAGSTPEHPAAAGGTRGADAREGRWASAMAEWPAALRSSVVWSYLRGRAPLYFKP